MGPEGPPGVAYGATQIAHGLVWHDGSLISGSGISSIEHSGVGSYRIYFDPVYETSSIPTCIVNAQNTDGQAFGLFYDSAASISVSVYTILHGVHPPTYIDGVGFTIFCVQ